MYVSLPDKFLAHSFISHFCQFIFHLPRPILFNTSYTSIEFSSPFRRFLNKFNFPFNAAIKASFCPHLKQTLSSFHNSYFYILYDHNSHALQKKMANKNKKFVLLAVHFLHLHLEAILPIRVCFECMSFNGTVILFNLMLCCLFKFSLLSNVCLFLLTVYVKINQPTRVLFQTDSLLPSRMGDTRFIGSPMNKHNKCPNKSSLLLSK